MFSHDILMLIFLTSLCIPLFSKSYTDDWIVHLEDHGDAASVAELYGFENKGQISVLDNVYHFQRKKRSGKHNRVKRGTREKRHVTDELKSHHMIRTAVQDEILDIEKRSKSGDPLWSKQWFLNDNGKDKLFTINVKGAWDKGYSGKGVVVSVIDDGLEWRHKDIAANYDPEASFNLQKNIPDPTPRYTSYFFEENAHGTRCAGEIAAVRNNSVCGVGVAFNAKIGGILVLDGAVTRVMESKALGYNLNHIDIFSASWGPPDDGKSMDGPNGITIDVLDKAITEGRGGKGTIYIWADGNGGFKDDCNADGYQTMRHSISINAIDEKGNVPNYAEPCAAALASTFSSGSLHSIATTDLHGDCTKLHSGTSAAAPIAAGMVALVLEANSNLTWRDVQHIIINAADPNILFFHEGWTTNAANRATHINFGYGSMDATKMVELAKNWVNVGDAHRCKSPKLKYSSVITAKKTSKFKIKFDRCEGKKNEVRYLEHVYLEINLSTGKRGDISVQLESPSFTDVHLISTRRYDNDKVGFKDWRLMTVFFFGEDPKGTWTVTINNEGKYDATLNSMFLDVFGTEEEPMTAERPPTGPNVCNKLCKDPEQAGSTDTCQKCKSVVNMDVARRELNLKRRSDS